MDRQYKDEATLLRKVTEWLEPQQRDGIKMIRICNRYSKGISDVFICARGRFIVAELKKDIGVATPHQTQFIKEMIEAGAVGGICRSVKDVHDLIGNAIQGCDQCKTGTIHIHIPKFEANLISNQHLNHEAFDIDLRPPFCLYCGKKL